MAGEEELGRLRVEIESLRRELAELRSEQRKLAHLVEAMDRSFRQIAVQLGIAAEPYRRRGEPPPSNDLPGFA